MEAIVQKSNLIIDPIRVVITKVDPDATDEDIRAFAYAKADETPESCFGSRVYRWDARNALVVIYRD